MNEEEKRKKILEYIALAGRRALTEKEMDKLSRELGISHKEILELGKAELIKEFEAPLE